MPDPSVALRALRQIRSGADSPVRRLAERAAARPDKLAGMRTERMDYIDDVAGEPDPSVLAEMQFRERSAENPDDADDFVLTAYKPRTGLGMEPGPKGGREGILGAMDQLGAVLAQLDTGYEGREALRGDSEPPPAYSAAGMAPEVGGMEDDDEDDLDRTVAALFRR